MNNNSHIEINETALAKNYAFIRTLIGEDCELVAVIKGNAYGHGIQHFVPVAQRCGVHSFAVFSATEAIQAKEVLENEHRLLIMGFMDEEEMNWAIEQEVEFFVFGFDRLVAVQKKAAQLNKKAIIHIELETGLNRTGFTNLQLSEALQFIQQHTDQFIIEGLCTHFAGAENIVNHERIQKQIASFNEMSAVIADVGIPVKHEHLACSAALISHPKSIKKFVRVGIMQYGFWPSKEIQMAYCTANNIIQNPLHPVISWKSRIMSIKLVNQGDFVGYGNLVMAEKAMKIAIVPVGYSDGYSRSLSNQGKVLINGLRWDVIGTVNMNMIAVDITNIEKAEIGDEVVLIGNQGEFSITVASFSDLSTQLNYELLTRLPKDIPRKIIA